MIPRVCLIVLCCTAVLAAGALAPAAAPATPTAYGVFCNTGVPCCERIDPSQIVAPGCDNASGCDGCANGHCPCEKGKHAHPLVQAVKKLSTVHVEVQPVPLAIDLNVQSQTQGPDQATREQLASSAEQRRFYAALLIVIGVCGVGALIVGFASLVRSSSV